jgi:hypothetical protein
LGRKWNEKVVVHFKVMLQHLPGRAEENNKNLSR